MIQRDEGSDASPDWKVFDEWNLVPPLSDMSSTQPAPMSLRVRSSFRATNGVASDWNAVDDMLAAFTGVFRNRYFELSELLEEWDRLLAAFGGDPTKKDWRRFRPLRLSREEDWSDWLAYLIESSETGAFSCFLLGDSASNQSNYAQPRRTEREVAHNDCRADLIVEWATEGFTHIEVKVGDLSLSKTLSTSRLMRHRFRQPPERWSNYILLLSPQIPDWESLDREVTGEPPVKAVTWDAVCVSLRRALQSGEKMPWKVFAYSMVGAIEQFLVGYPGFRLIDRPVENMEAKMRILREGLLHE